MELNRDLSFHHGLISELFPDISAQEAWEKYKLSDSQVAFFEEYGYLSNIKLLEKEQIIKLKEELSEIRNPNHPKHDLFYEFHSNESENPDQVLFHSLGHWRISPAFHDVLWNPRFVVPASQLLGTKAVRFWHDQLFCKPAHHGGVVAWHQDYSYWTRTGPMQHLTCWVALDHANSDNGCLNYIPGSHRWELLDRTSLAGNMDGLSRFLTEDQKEQFGKKLAIEMPPGCATFHHPLMVHGSFENKSPRSRQAFVLNVFADGTRSNSGDELLAGVPPVPKNEKLEGRFFPLLYKPPVLNP